MSGIIKRNNLTYNIPSSNELKGSKTMELPNQILVKDVVLVEPYKIKVLYTNGDISYIKLTNNSVKSFTYNENNGDLTLKTNDGGEYVVKIVSSGGSTLWEVGEGDILSPLNNRTFTLKKAYEINSETGDTTKRLNEQGDFTPVQITDIPTLPETLTRLEDNTPLHTKRYLTGEEFVINGITYYKSVYTKPDEPLYTIEKVITGTSIETATTVATFVGFPALDKEITLPMQDIAVIVEVRKTGVRTCNLFVVFSELRGDYSIVTYGTSGIRVIGTTATTEVLYIPIAGHTAPIGASSMLEIKGYSSGGGSANTVYVDVQNHTGSRFSYVVGIEGTKSHPALTDKNEEPEFQHVDSTTTKETLVANDKVVIYDSVTGNLVLTDKTNVGGGSTDITSTTADNTTSSVIISTATDWQRTRLTGSGNILTFDFENGVLPNKNKEYLLVIMNARSHSVTATTPTGSFVKNGVTYSFIYSTATFPVNAGKSAEVNVIFYFIDATTCSIRILTQPFM
jgi:hypothetical protein